jgi:hypothetical protein
MSIEKWCMWWCMPVTPATVGRVNRRILDKKQDLISKKTTMKRTGSMTQGVGHLASRHEALTQN